MKTGDLTKFIYISEADFLELPTKDPAALYFVVGSGQNVNYISVGTEMFSNSQDVTSLSTRILSLETWRNSIADGDSAMYGG